MNSHLNFSFDDENLHFLEKQRKHSYVVPLRRYWWIFRSNFRVDSPGCTSSTEILAEVNGHVWAAILILEIAGLFTVAWPFPLKHTVGCLSISLITLEDLIKSFLVNY